MSKSFKRRIVKTIYIGHYCKDCVLNDPPLLFEGKIEDNGRVMWPVIVGYHISYCPHCGIKLPIKEE